MSSVLTRCLSFAALALVTACGAADGAADEPAVEASEQLTTSIKGLYTVPVSDARLAPHATFPVTVKTKTLPNGDVRLHYDLPVELVGSVQAVDMVGSPGSPTMTGAIGTAECVDTDGQTVCREKLGGVAVDPAGVAAALDAKQLPAFERQAVLDVSERFGTDPIGVLSFTSRARQGNGRHGGR